MLKLYSYIKTTKTLGPFNRFALWTQGCPFDCAGCMTPDSQSFDDGFDMAIDEIVNIITDTKDIEGITISGGEPFVQAKVLVNMIDKIKNKKDLGVIVYSGFTLEQLKDRNDKFINKLLEYTDILIDGKYEDNLNDNISLRGSSNQNIYQLSNRYNKVFDKYYNKNIREIELHFDDKNMMLVGIPKKETV